VVREGAERPASGGSGSGDTTPCRMTGVALHTGLYPQTGGQGPASGRVELGGVKRGVATILVAGKQAQSQVVQELRRLRGATPDPGESVGGDAGEGSSEAPNLFPGGGGGGVALVEARSLQKAHFVLGLESAAVHARLNEAEDDAAVTALGALLASTRQSYRRSFSSSLLLSSLELSDVYQ